MSSYFLTDYKLSCLELVQSLVVSEYGLRHLEQAELCPEQKWGHRLIALIEFIPVLGQVAMLIEWIAFNALLGTSIRREWLFNGSQNGAVGWVRQDRVMNVLDSIDRRKENGIVFNRSKVTGSIEGGVCTAMALDFAESFFHLRRIHVKTGPESTEIFLNSIRNLKSRFAASSEEMRNRQAAFNTIEVRRDVTGVDIARNKIQSLANLHHFRIDHASREIQVGLGDLNKSLQEETQRLPDGLYLLRTIEPSQNEKLEVHGHSMIYVKERQEGFFYDPNAGARYMSNVDHVPEISRTLAQCHQLFRTSTARFYRLAPSGATHV